MRKALYLFAVLAVGASLVVAGCSKSGTTEKPPKTAAKDKAAPPPPPAADDDAEIQTALAKLNPEDRKRAEAQKWCAIQTGSRLGSMDTPYKVMIGDQPVFLCCKGCQRKALADPDKTLATVAELKAKAAAEKK